MSIVVLLLFLLAVGGGGTIIYGGYRLFRSAKIDDEVEERERLAEEALRIEELEKKYPGLHATLNKKKIKKFTERT
jgi:threonine/homoserine/homoserine lactone efflux protein